MAVQRQMPSAQSVEQIRARARRRLIGAFVLVVIAVVLFAWLFDSSPRQTNVDIPIEIAGQTEGSVQTGEQVILIDSTESGSAVVAQGELVIDVPDEGAAAVTEGTDVEPNQNNIAQVVIDTGVDVQTPEQATDTLPQEGVSVYNYGVRPANMVSLKSKYSPNAPAPANTSAQVASGSQQRPALTDKERQAAILLGDLPASSVSTPATSVRQASGETGQKFVVQVGAYADQGKVDEVRAKLLMNGYSSFVQEVQSDAGKRIRVRVGPFNGRYAADSAAEKIKALGLQVSVMAQ